ncbi:MAG: glycosyltransferase family protein [Anaerolineae bacterium]|nr:glycosyltransferase family protein [Anaerolineae bacterium]
MKIVAIVQARMGSTRLPGKVMLPILGKPMLQVIVERIRAARRIDQIVVATSVGHRDNRIASLVQSLDNVCLFRGSEEDVLSRYYQAACTYHADIVLRVTADNPFFHAPTADELIALVQDDCDYASNSLIRTFPYGIDLEAFWFSALGRAYHEANEPYQREHVTPYIRENPALFRLRNLALEQDLSGVRLTVDTRDDYERAVMLFDRFGERVEFEDVIGWLQQNSH